MDTCGLERVERFRINLNEKNLASHRNTLTRSLPAKMPSRWHLRQRATIRLSTYPTSVLLPKGNRIRVAQARRAKLVRVVASPESRALTVSQHSDAYQDPWNVRNP